MDIMVIGIAGGTGSGKTTITKKLVQRFGGDVSVIYHDNYYKAHHNMPYEERAKLNYDHPDSFDTDILIEDLKQAPRGAQHQVSGLRLLHSRPHRQDDNRPPRESYYSRRHTDIPEPRAVRSDGH